MIMIKHKSVISVSLILLIIALPVNADQEKFFQRIATFPVFLNSSIENETIAEIVAASRNGKTLIYTDGKMEAVGFVDIENAREPKPAGLLPVGGKPTSVAVKKNYALVAVNTSLDFVNVSGKLVVVNIKSKKIEKTIALGGQPDSIAVSPNGKYAAIVIENERNEDFNDGLLPQLPAGQLIIVDLHGHPSSWSTRSVNLSNMPGMLYPTDPEPEYVDINGNNIAVITLQENNHIALVNLETGDIQNHFSAGTQELNQIDIADDKLIALEAGLNNVPREPDGVSWIDNIHFVTADEGDLAGGSRGFTIYHIDGGIVFQSGSQLEHAIVRHGHYPDKRSGNKGNEPENVEIGIFKDNKYLFVGSERASVILVYDINKPAEPEFKQILPSAVKPEGLIAIPKRKLMIAAGEEDARNDKIRSALTIYEYRSSDTNYPTVVSVDRSDGTPIPWGALSGLAADPTDENNLYAIHDSFYNKARIFSLNINDKPAVIEREILLTDSMRKLAAIDISMVNSDGTVSIDAEGIAVRKSGGFWIASEGAGTVGDSESPFKTFNLIIGVSSGGDIDQVIQLPASTNTRQVGFGFEGVASIGAIDNEILYVAFQREWADDLDGHVRIGRYDVTKEKWRFYYYPLEMPLSAAGGWIGLSEITALDDDNFLVIERDNQGNADAAIKRIYQFSTVGLTPLEDPDVGVTPEFPVVKKILVRDLMEDLAKTSGLILEKIEGMAVTKNGGLCIVNDNDGVDDSNGETQLLKIHVD